MPFDDRIETVDAADGRRARGDASRRLILAHAADMASIEGLDGLTISRVAAAAGVSKSGVATLFGSKQQLQLAAIEAATERFTETVILPPRSAARGLSRVVATLTQWIGYSRERVFPGGCFFASTIADVDAKDGPVHDAIAAAMNSWSEYLGTTLRQAIDLGELDADADPAQLAFVCTALLDAANTRSLLTRSNAPYGLARRGLATALLAAGADPRALDPLVEYYDGA